MEKQKIALNHELRSLAENARALMVATADVCGDEVAVARERLASALENSKELYGRARERTLNGARAADHVLRDNPYQVVVLALGVGAVIGFFAARK